MLFERIQSGVIFEFRESFFIKIKAIRILAEDDIRMVNAIQLSNGMYWRFKEDEQIKVVTTMPSLLESIMIR